MQQMSMMLLSQKNESDAQLDMVQDIKMGGWFPDYMMSYVMFFQMNTTISNWEVINKKMND